jgi:hypothetical protein
VTSREPAPLPESDGAADGRATHSHGAGTSPNDPGEDGNDAVSDAQDGFEYIELADGPDGLPEAEVMPDAVVIDGVLTSRGMPEWADFERWWQQEHGPRPDPDVSHQSLMDEIEREIILSGMDTLQGVTDKSIRDRTADSIRHVLSGQIDPRFEHIATWWDRYTERPRTRTPTFLRSRTKGRKRLEESPSSPGRAYAEQARDLLARGEVRTTREAAERLMVDYHSLGDDSIAVRRAIRAAEVRLNRYLRRFPDLSE